MLLNNNLTLMYFILVKKEGNFRFMSLNKGTGTVCVLATIGIFFHFFPTFFRKQAAEDKPKSLKDLTQQK